MVAAVAWWGFASAVLAGLVLRFFVGDRLFVTRYTGYVMPWLLLALVPGAARAWATERDALAAALAASAAIVVLVHAPLFRRPPPAPPPPGLVLRAMSYNTWSRNLDADRIASVILRQRPDVLLIQEIEPDVLARLTAALRTLYEGSPVHLAHEPEIGQAIVSRWPVESSTSLRRKGNAQRAVLRTPAGPVTVFNVHPLRIGGWHRRYSKLEALLREDVAAVSGPVILGGDFNAPARSDLHRLLSRALREPQAERGVGFGFTYPAALGSPLGVVPALPLVRIDHLFVSRQVVALRAGTLEDAGGSDHRPIWADLALPATAPQEAARSAGAPALATER
jgi:vancomycin resistance protein VanJ